MGQGRKEVRNTVSLEPLANICKICADAPMQFFLNLVLPPLIAFLGNPVQSFVVKNQNFIDERIFSLEISACCFVLFSYNNVVIISLSILK